MKLVLFGPLGTGSAAGRATARVVPSLLDQGHQVYVVRTETPEQQREIEPQPLAPVLSWTDDAQVEAAVNEADAVVFSVGNDFAFHAGCLEWMPRRRGLLCLYDFAVPDLFDAWATTHPKRARKAVRHWYGPEIAARFANQRAEFLARSALDSPMTEWIAAEAHAVLAPSHWDIERAIKACPGPTRLVPFPYDGPEVTREAMPTAGSRVELLTMTDGAADDGVESLIRAIGSSRDLKDGLRYRVRGTIPPRMALELQGLALELGVDVTIEESEGPTDKESGLATADIACFLRWPSVETTTTGILAAMLHGNAIVTNHAGFARELPDDCAALVSSASPVDELRNVLTHLVTDPVHRRAMAERGRAWAEATFTADNYARGIVAGAELMLRARPVITMTWQLGLVLRKWGATEDVLTAPEITGPLEIFGSPSLEA